MKTSGRIVVFAVAVVTLMASASAQRFSDWSAPLNVGPVVNNDYTDFHPSISRDGLSLYYAGYHPNSPDEPPDFDIYVSHRDSLDSPWGPPQKLGPNVNSSSWDNGPMISVDGHSLYFASERPGGYGGMDLYVSRRTNKWDDNAWEPAVNLGPLVNTSGGENGPCIFEDDDTAVITLYFQSNRSGGKGGADIYASTMGPDGTFGVAHIVDELSSPSGDQAPAISRNGLEMYLASNRPGTLGDQDLWVSTRATTADLWSTPVNLGPTVNSTYSDGLPALSFKGTELYFMSTRPGHIGSHLEDLWVCTRTKLTRPE